MPYKEYFLDKLEATKHSKNCINPVQIEMIKKGLVFNEFNEKNVEYYEKNIENFLKLWYNTDIEKFWEEVLR